MKPRYQLEINEIKGKLNFGRNPWFVDFLLTVFIGIPLIIIGGPFWLLGNGFYYVFVKPFEKEKTWNDLNWKEIENLNGLVIEKSDPINMFLDKKEQEWFDEDPVFALKTNSAHNPLKEKVFSDFLKVFDGKIFLQELLSVYTTEEFNIKSKLISIEPETLRIELIEEFDYYYLKATEEQGELTIKGTDQLGSKFEMKIKNTLANSGYK